MSKAVLDKDQWKLINQFSLEKALDDTDNLFNIGGKVVGTPEDFRAVKLIEV